MTPDQPELTNPFPGLRPFREDEAHLFFGRESQIDRLVDGLARSRFLAVVGTSGSGKSSLVNCGLRPALHRGLMASAGTSWRIAQFRPGSSPMRSMARALAKDSGLFSSADAGPMPLEEIVKATLGLSKLGLVDVYEQAHLEGINLLVVVDQFEELFRYRNIAHPETGEGTRNQQAVAFVNLLLEAKTQKDYPIYVALTMRSDFLGDCAELPGLPEAINDGQYLVPRMTRAERKAAIAGPVGVGKGSISPVLLTRLVNDVGDNPDQLSILQHALNRTWARWQHSNPKEPSLSLEHYESVGTMAHALDQHANKAFGELKTDRQRKICEAVFKAITDRGSDVRGIRRPTRLAKLCDLAGATEAEVIAVLDVFRKPSRSFLMPPMSEKLDGDSIIDISHESLMRVWELLKTWADEEALSAQLYRRLAETAALHTAGKASLWRERELQLAETWFDTQRPTAAWAERYAPGFESTVAFLAASKALRDKEVFEEEEGRKRQMELEKTVAVAHEQELRLALERKSASRLRRLVAALAVMFVGACGVGVYAWYQRDYAVEQAKLVVERTNQLEDSTAPTLEAAAAVSDIATQLSGYYDTLYQIDAETTDPRLKALIRQLSSGVQNWEKSAGDADRNLRSSLLKQQDIVAVAAPAKVAKEGWIFLGKVNERQDAWVEGSPKTIAPTEPKLAQGAALSIVDDVYLREDVNPGTPRAEGAILSVVKAPTTAMVTQVDYSHARGGGWFVWAKVRN